MSDKEERDKAKMQMLHDLFQGAKGRGAKTDQELDEWLATPEGIAATAYEVTSVSRWGNTGRS